MSEELKPFYQRRDQLSTDQEDQDVCVGNQSYYTSLIEKPIAERAVLGIVKLLIVVVRT